MVGLSTRTAGGNKQTAQKMKDFLVYLQQHKPEGMEIMWYDSMTDDGYISWQNHLTDKNKGFLQDNGTRVSDSMFLNFWWNNQQSSFNKAKEIGRSPYDLYAGIDVEANGINTNIPWQGIFPKGEEPLVSLGIYHPDWAFKTSENIEQFYQKENEFWLGSPGTLQKQTIMVLGREWHIISPPKRLLGNCLSSLTLIPEAESFSLLMGMW